MIISVSDLKGQVDCGKDAYDAIKARLDGIEHVIRSYTNNAFQVPAVRFCGRSEGSKVYGDPGQLMVGDTVQVSKSGVNDGLYTIERVEDDGVTLDDMLLEAPRNLVTKVEYPPDVARCAVRLYEWEQSMGGKVGVKSETISRHSVTYEDSQTLFAGYPVGILNGLKLYAKARF